MAKHRQWHLSGWQAVLLAPIAVVVALTIKVAEVIGLKATADLSTADVASYLDDFIHGRSAAWDWDDFTSIRITDPALEQIRQEAAAVRLPLNQDGEAKLKELLRRAQSLGKATSA